MQPKILLMLGVYLVLAHLARGQSFFRYLEKPQWMHEPAPFTPHLAAASPDSVLNAWRPITNIAAYGYPGNLLMAGAGLGYQHLVFSSLTQRWTAQWSVNAMGFAGGSVAPTTAASIASVGILAGVYNNLVMFGPGYNFGTKQFMAIISIGISLNN